MDHIDAMDQLKYGIDLKTWSARSVIEYKQRGFDMFKMIQIFSRIQSVILHKEEYS